jgi:hypothetical protein
MEQCISNGPAFYVVEATALDTLDERSIIRLTDYELDSPVMGALSKLYSPRRWISIDDCVIRPGHGEGTAVIDGSTYRISYAFRGLTEYDICSGDINKVLSWSVVVTPMKGREGTFKIELRDWLTAINGEEGRKTAYEIPIKAFLENEGFDPTEEGYRKSLEDLRDYYLRSQPGRKEQIMIKYSPENIAKRVEVVFSRGYIVVPNLLYGAAEVEPWRYRLDENGELKQDQHLNRST